MNSFRPLISVVLAGTLATTPVGFAASHREAPITALDTKADITDIYAFVSYDDPTKVTLILNVDPLLEPGNGPNYFPFDDNVLYSILIDNTNTALPNVAFQFQFQTHITAPPIFTALCRRRNRHKCAAQFASSDCAGYSNCSPGDYSALWCWRGRLEFEPDIYRQHGAEWRQHSADERREWLLVCCADQRWPTDDAQLPGASSTRGL